MNSLAPPNVQNIGLSTPLLPTHTVPLVFIQSNNCYIKQHFPTDYYFGSLYLLFFLFQNLRLINFDNPQMQFNHIVEDLERHRRVQSHMLLPLQCR